MYTNNIMQGFYKRGLPYMVKWLICGDLRCGEVATVVERFSCERGLPVAL